jgi:hypothetical protein
MPRQCAREGAASRSHGWRCIACYGIPEQVQPLNGAQITNRYTSRQRVECSMSPTMA